MRKHRWYEHLLLLGLLCLLAGVGYLSFERGSRGQFDFRHFYLDARYVWEHAELNPHLDEQVPPDERRQLPFYLPAVPLALAPITAFGRTPAAIVWSLAQMAALALSLSILWRWWVCSSPLKKGTGSEPNPLGNGENALPRGARTLFQRTDRDCDVPDSSVWAVRLPQEPVAYARRLPRPAATGAFAVAVLLAVPAFLEAGKFNQLSYFVLALVLAAVTALERERPKLAGALFGVAAVLKLLPGIFLIWLLLKRRWSAAIALVVVALVFALVPPLSVFGPQRTAEYHRQWWLYNVQGEAAQGLLSADLAEHFIDRRNQSIAQVLARLTWPAHPYAAPGQPVHLDPQTCARLAYGITAVLLLALLWVTRRPWHQLSPHRRHAEAAVYAIGMLVFSPLLRQYYLVWAVPALVLLARIAVDNTAMSSGVRSQRLGQVGLVVWAAGMVVWAWRIARVLGAHLLMLITIGVLLLWATNEPAGPPRLNRDEKA